MKKIYFALVAMLPLSFVACSVDDGDEDKTDYPVNLHTPTTADAASSYEFSEPLVPTSGSSLQLKGFEFTESGKIIVELRDDVTNRLSYVMGDATWREDALYITGNKVNGRISANRPALCNTRSTMPSGDLYLDLTVTLGEILNYVTENDPVNAVITDSGSIADEVMNNLSRTWNILGAIVDLKGNDIKAYEEFESHNGIFYLSDVLEEAVQQGVSISEHDRAALNRQIKSVTMTKSQKFIINYVDGSEDVASWTWANAEKTRINIDLLDQDMGNIFVSNDTKLQISFRDNRCNLRLETRITDDSGKIWEGSLTLKLQSVD